MNRSVLIASCIMLALVLWMALGMFGCGGSPSAAELGDASAQDRRASVRIRSMQAEAVAREVVFSGRTEEARGVELRSEVGGRIVEVGAERGSTMAAGEKVVLIEEQDRRGRVSFLESLVQQRQVEFNSAERLSEQGLQSENRLAEAKALLEQARADLEAAQLALDKTLVVAPFDGVLDDRMVEIGDFVSSGDPVARYLELDPLVVTGQVTEREVGRLNLGQKGAVALADGRQVEGMIRYLAPSADPDTRTFTVELELSNPDRAIPAGLTAQVTVFTDEVEAHFVTPALLALDGEGQLGVKLANERDEVVFAPARLVKTEPNGVWLGGLPKDIRLITVGQGFVREGDKVIPREESEPDSTDGSEGELAGGAGVGTR